MSEHVNKYGCPSARELELFSLDEIASQPSRLFIRDHLQYCTRCQRKHRHFKAFYAMLSKELDDSFSPSTIDYCKHRAPRRVKYGFLLCTPIPDKNNDAKAAFLATLAFSANGDGSKNRLVDFELPKQDIGIMLYTDPARQELLLFLWCQARKNFDQWRLAIPGISIDVVFNRHGFSKIPLTNLENLHNQLCYFSLTAPQKQPERILEKIQNLIA